MTCRTLLWSPRQRPTFMRVASVALFAFVEAGFRRRLTNLVSSTNTGLAEVAAPVIVYEFLWQLAILAVRAAGIYTL